jgi:hypothetical protein
VIDHRHREALALQVADPQQVLGIDVVGGARIARIALRIARVQLVLGVAAAQQPPLIAESEDDAARLERVLLLRLRANRLALLGRDHRLRRAARQRGDDGDLVAVLQRGGEAAQGVDGLAVDVERDVGVHLAALVAHEPLETAERALQLVEQTGDVGRDDFHAVAVGGGPSERRGDVHAHHGVIACDRTLIRG